jgi:hypothetical protein
MSSQVNWKNTTARSLAQVTDALTKWVTSLGVNEKVARQWIPGWTDQLEAENERLARPLRRLRTRCRRSWRTLTARAAAMPTAENLDGRAG